MNHTCLNKIIFNLEKTFELLYGGCDLKDYPGITTQFEQFISQWHNKIPTLVDKRILPEWNNMLAFLSKLIDHFNDIIKLQKLNKQSTEYIELKQHTSKHNYIIELAHIDMALANARINALQYTKKNHNHKHSQTFPNIIGCAFLLYIFKSKIIC